MIPLPFFIVPLTHPTWEEALAYARGLAPDALPELRLDHFPELDPEGLVDALHRRCLVTCRRRSEGGLWPDEDETGRLERLRLAMEGRPAWVELEWELPIPGWLEVHRSHTRLLRSVHVPPGIFDLEARLANLPEGEAFTWVGEAGTLADNARLKQPLAWARDHNLWLCAFLEGPKGIPSQCLQAAWGGGFTYAAPGDGPSGSPWPLPLPLMRGWRLPRQHRDLGLGGVLGESALESPSPAFHNETFQRQLKNLFYLPLECGDAPEALEALEALDLVAVNLTGELRFSVPEPLGLPSPLDTLWRQHPGAPWQGANIGAEILVETLESMAPGPVVLLGQESGVMTSESKSAIAGREVLTASTLSTLTPEAVAGMAPVGVLQVAGFPEEGAPSVLDLLKAAHPSLRWAIEWTPKEHTAFAAWVQEAGLERVRGQRLFDLQAQAQSRRFVRECA